MNDMSWPIWTLEMTPSSATSDSYPLEVGVACWPSPDAVVSIWSSPINPVEISDWLEPRAVFLEAAGLDEASLKSGLEPAEVSLILNDIFMTGKVFGKGGTVDVHLANRLNLAARVWPTYSLVRWDEIGMEDSGAITQASTLIRQAQGDAAERACAIAQGIALILGHSPSCRRVATMAETLPF